MLHPIPGKDVRFAAAKSLQVLVAEGCCHSGQRIPADAPAEATSLPVHPPLGRVLPEAAADDCDVVRGVHAQRLVDQLLCTALGVVVLTQPDGRRNTAAGQAGRRPPKV